VASQFHPEFKSRPEHPAPLFREFVAAALARARVRRPEGEVPTAEGGWSAVVGAPTAEGGWSRAAG
jgi:hypothetical protein